MLGRGLPKLRTAILKGYRIYHAPPLDYPLILPDPAGYIKGYLWDLRKEDFPVLDHYEGTDDDPPLYFRQWVDVEVDGKPERAQVYVGNPLGWPAGRLQPEE